MPRWDRERAAAPITFAVACLKRSLLDSARSFGRRVEREKTNPVSVIAAADDGAHGRAQGIMREAAGEGYVSSIAATPSDAAPLDHTIERLAADLMERPEAYLTADQARIFRAWLASPRDQTQGELAAAMGYSRASSLSMMMGRIKQRIADLLEHMDIEAGEGIEQAAERLEATQRENRQSCEARPVLQIDDHGDEIARFESVAAAATTTSTTPSGIIAACRRGWRAGGTHWRYVEETPAEKKR